MNEGLLMCVLNAVAGLDEEFKPLADRELVLIAVFGDRWPRHVLHDEVRLALRCCAGVEHFGNRRMIHDGQ